MLIPVSKNKFTELTDTVDELYRRWVQSNPEIVNLSTMKTVAGFLLSSNFTIKTLTDEGGYEKIRDKWAAWLVEGRGRKGLQSISFFKKDLSLANPIKIAGNDVSSLSSAYEAGGILGALAAALGVELRYVNDAQDVSTEYTGAAALARERFAFPVKRRKVRFNKWGKKEADGHDHVDTIFDLIAASITPSTRPAPSGDSDLEFLAKIIFSVSVKRILLCGSVYVDEVAMIRDNAGMSVFGRTQQGVEAPVNAFVLHYQTELKKHKDFIAPAYFLRRSNDKETSVFEAVCDTISLTDPLLIDHFPYFTYGQLPAGKGKDMLALESKAGNFHVDDESLFFELWRPDVGYKGYGVNSVTAQFVLAYIRTYTGLGTAGSAGLASASTWRRFYMHATTVDALYKYANTSRGVWSDQEATRAYYLGFTAMQNDPKLMTASLLVYPAGIDKDRADAIKAVNGRKLRIVYTQPAAKYSDRVTYTHDVTISVEVPAQGPWKVTFSWRDEV